MDNQTRVVDNRVFLLGLDELYREAMKRHERTELLECAKATAAILSVKPVNDPIEGYYTEDERLTEYFRLIRALQRVSPSREAEVVSLSDFARLKRITASGIFGRPIESDSLLPGGEDPLTVALGKTFPNWDIENLANMAYRSARESDDFSLVGLAALARDPVVLAALRESVVLYAGVAGSAEAFTPQYAWKVDEFIASRAHRFVDTFNHLFDERLPQPVAANAEIYWDACDTFGVVGRCVRIGFDETVQPVKHYHWAIDLVRGELMVQDFWDTELWTTQRYRERMETRI